MQAYMVRPTWPWAQQITHTHNYHNYNATSCKTHKSLPHYWREHSKLKPYLYSTLSRLKLSHPWPSLRALRVRDWTHFSIYRPNTSLVCLSAFGRLCLCARAGCVNSLKTKTCLSGAAGKWPCAAKSYPCWEPLQITDHPRKLIRLAAASKVLWKPVK